MGVLVAVVTLSIIFLAEQRTAVAKHGTLANETQNLTS